MSRSRIVSHRSGEAFHRSILDSYNKQTRGYCGNDHHQLFADAHHASDLRDLRSADCEENEQERPCICDRLSYPIRRCILLYLRDVVDCSVGA